MYLADVFTVPPSLAGLPARLGARRASRGAAPDRDAARRPGATPSRSSSRSPGWSRRRRATWRPSAGRGPLTAGAVSSLALLVPRRGRSVRSLRSASAPRRVDVSEDFAVRPRRRGDRRRGAPPRRRDRRSSSRGASRADEATAGAAPRPPGAPSADADDPAPVRGALGRDEARRRSARSSRPTCARRSGGSTSPSEEERLAAIAAWFTGDAACAAPARARENGLTGDAVAAAGRYGEGSRSSYLLPPFRDAEPIPDEEPPRLEYGEDEKGKLRRLPPAAREALYSAVVVRFTGRLHAADVIELALGDRRALRHRRRPRDSGRLSR